MDGSILATNDTPTIIFALSSILAGIILWKCSTPPNPKPAHAEKNDLLFNQSSFGIFLSGFGIYIWSYLFIVAGLFAAVLTLDWDHAHSWNGMTGRRADGSGNPGDVVDISRTVCPNYENLERAYIKPSIFSVACIGTTIFFGLLRLEAFRQLGRNFTFQLARPSGLMTGGIYGYIQHPSYTGAFFMLTAIFFLWVQPKGLMGCFLPEWLAGSRWLVWGLRAYYGGGMAWMMCGRVVQEERMLKREFGKEWVEYHGRTARFIPGVV